MGRLASWDLCPGATASAAVGGVMRLPRCPGQNSWLGMWNWSLYSVVEQGFLFSSVSEWEVKQAPDPVKLVDWWLESSRPANQTPWLNSGTRALLCGWAEMLDGTSAWGPLPGWMVINLSTGCCKPFPFSYFSDSQWLGSAETSLWGDTSVCL